MVGLRIFIVNQLIIFEQTFFFFNGKRPSFMVKDAFLINHPKSRFLVLLHMQMYM